MIIDTNCYYGTWPTLPVRGALAEVADRLQRYHIDRLFISPLQAVWNRDQQGYNRDLLQRCDGDERLFPTPVIDPTLPTWKQELESYGDSENMKMVRLFPNYVPYDAAAAGSLFEACSAADIAVFLQTRMEDPRNQHPLAVVPDADHRPFLELAASFPSLKLILGGMTAAVALRDAEHVLASGACLETSRIEGVGALRKLADAGLRDRLVFGSHAPLFEPYGALARVLQGLDDPTVESILHRNARRFLS